MRTVVAMMLTLTACARPAPRDPPVRDLRAERFTLELLACVDRASTIAESRACRAEVEARYADGGAR